VPRVPYIRLAIALAACAATVTAPVRAQSGPREISNIATCQYLSEPALPPPSGGATPPVVPLEVESNEVLTPVVAIASLNTLILSVNPGGTVAPAQRLIYTLAARNGPDEDLSQLQLVLPMDPGLDVPLSWTDGLASLVGDGQIPVTGFFDPAGPAVFWDLPLLAAGQEVRLQVEVPILAAIPADTLITMQGHLDALELTAQEDSNTVISAVIPPVLLVRKMADRSTAAPGDTVGFHILVTHTGSEPALTTVDLLDFLPDGLRYVDGSVRVDDQPAAVTPETGGRLRIPLGALAPGESRTIRLATLVGPVSQARDLVNTAQAEGVSAGGALLTSAPAAASMRVIPGVFRREAYLLGRVFLDLDGDGMPAATEPGVPGVLVALEDGRGAVTDIAGQWHIEGVRPGLHVARLDPGTLPAPLRPRAAGADWVGDADTRFIEARASTLVTADFPVAGGAGGLCSVHLGSASIALPAASLADGDGYPRPESANHLDQAAALLLQSTPGPGNTDVQITCSQAAQMPPETITELRSRLRRSTSVYLQASQSGLGDDTRASDASFEELLRSQPAQAAIITPVDGSTASRRRVDVEIIYPDDFTPVLTVNGRLVPRDRIGTTSVLPSRKIAAARYIGVELGEGGNVLHLRATPTPDRDAEPQVAETRVYLPGRAVALQLSVPEGRWIADGHTPPILRVEAVDGAGQVSIGREIVTLLVEGARPLGQDLEPDEDGWQIRLDEGRGQLRLAPLLIPGQARVQAFTDGLESEMVIPVLPGGGDWTVTGLAEGRLAGDGGVEGDGGLAPGLDDGISDSGGRIALLARGPIGAASRLTVSVDTDRERDRDRLFGPFQPDAFFPTPGDAGVRVDQAQSQGPLFARLDAPIGFAQYGDFATGFQQTELARYDRRLTGLSGEATRGRFSFAGFAAASSQVVVRDVFSPDGTSGPYLLRSTPMVARSETVIFETRDRFRSEEVITRQVKVRDMDYSLDPISGTILFRGPVSPFDPDLNPVRVVVLYETRNGSKDRITAGGRMAFRPVESLESGLSMVHEERGGDPMDLYGIDLGWQPRPGLQLRTEIASTDQGEGSATAYRLELSGRQGANLEWDIAYRDLPLDFANPTLLAGPELGTRRASATARWRPSELWGLRAEILNQQDDRTGLERSVMGVESERQIGRFTALGTVRGVRGRRPGEDTVDAMLLEAGVRGRLARRWTAELLRRQVVGSNSVPGYPTRTAVQIAWEIRDGLQAVLRHEIESGDGPDRDRTLIGLENRLGRYTRSFARYALMQGAEGSTLRSTTGIETSFPISPHGSLNLAAARIDTSQGDSRADFTTLGGGYEYLDGAMRLSSRYELRLGETSMRHLLTAAGAFHTSPSWTVFAREHLSLQAPDAQETSLRAEGLLGLTFRPLAGRWRLLARVDHSTITGQPSTAAGVVPGIDDTLIPLRPGLGFGEPRSTPAVNMDSLAVTIAAGARIARGQRLAATLIVRLVDDGTFAEIPSTVTDLLSLHYTAVVRKRWTVGGSVRRFSQEQLDETSFGAGMEIGYLAMKNLWITGGYNIAGFRAADFPTNDHTEQGPFVSFRFKFDEKDWIPWRATRLDLDDESGGGSQD
jgi:uncharacterized repeat protein (TIGR01451 family)